MSDVERVGEKLVYKARRVYTGAGAPFTGGLTLEAGDIYIDDSNGDHYEYNGTAWELKFSSIVGETSDIRGETVGVIDQEQVGDTDAEWFFKSHLAHLELWSSGAGGEFKWLTIGDPNEGLSLEGIYSIRAAGFGGDEFIGGIFDGIEFRVSDVKVVGARGAAVADATDAPSVITQLNALLARLRTHGLIAT